MTSYENSVPQGFVPLKLKHAGYLKSIGPLYGMKRNGRFVLGLRIEDRHCNALGICHGGMLASLCDILLVIGLNVEGDLSEFLITVNLNSDFLASAPMGSWVEGQVELLQKTRQLVFGQGLLSLEDGTKLVRMNGVMKISGVRNPEFAPDKYFCG